MKKLSNTEAELKKGVAYKKSVCVTLMRAKNVVISKKNPLGQNMEA